MPAFIKDVKPFYGEYERDENGQTLEEFLEGYDATKYEKPCVTADIIVFRSKGKIEAVEEGLKLLMIQRRNHPSIGCLALPGGFAEIREDLMDSAKRELQEETGLSGLSLEQLYTYGEVERDPRARIITTSYLSIVDDAVAKVKAGDDAKNAFWMDLELRLDQKKKMQIDTKTKLQETYQLILSNKEAKRNASATVMVTRNEEGLLKEMEYNVLEKQKIAFDHARVIVQALLYLKERLILSQRQE